jgi:hypothetical protein
MPVAAWVGIGLLIALTFYFMFTYTGPYQWLAELQLKLMNFYSEKLTLLLTMLVLIVPAFGLVKLVAVVVSRMGPGAGRSGVAAGATPTKPAEMRLPQWIILPFLGLIVFGIGAVMYWRGATAGPLTAVNAKDLEDGKNPASAYLSIEGVPMWKETMRFKESSTKCYVPIVSPDWKGEAVWVYVECSDDDLPRPSAQLEIKTFKGMKAIGGLPGPVRVSFEKTMFKPAAGYLVIETKEEPAKLMGFGKWPMIVGAALVAAGMLWWGVKKMVAGR